MKRVVPFTYLDEPSIEASKLKEVISVEAPREDRRKEIIDYLEILVL